LRLTSNAVAWVTRELARRVGGLPVPLRYEDVDAPSEPCVVVSPTREVDWDAVLRRAATARCEVRGRALVFDADVVAATYFLLSRIEETDASKFDDHGRFPASAGAAFRLGLLDRPLVDEWALAIRDGLRRLLPDWTPDAPRFRVKLTHDVDSLRAFNGVGVGMRTVAGDLVKRRDVGRAIHDAAETFRQVAAPETSPNWRGALELARLSRIHGLRSAFYFMATGPVAGDADYDLSARDVRELMEELRALEVEFGVHPGYATLGDPVRLAAEKSRLDAAFGAPVAGGRQHYLRFRVPDTWRHWAQAGLGYDSTLGFADREGFRCGTCHPFRPFDVENDREIELVEFPLIAMDATLRHHRGLTPEATERRLLELAETCRRVGGTFTLLWHNSSLDGAWRPWGDVYRRLVPVLAQMERGTA
jgi:hypothetical protein